MLNLSNSIQPHCTVLAVGGRAVTRVVVACREIQLFRAMDTNHDQSITTDELRAGLVELGFHAASNIAAANKLLEVGGWVVWHCHVRLCVCACEGGRN